VLSDFRNGRCPVLIATDVAARGLDVKDIRFTLHLWLFENRARLSVQLGTGYGYGDADNKCD
jgi:hypothetical protein